MTSVMSGDQFGGGGDSPQDNIPVQLPGTNPAPSPNVLKGSDGRGEQGESNELHDGQEPDFPLTELANLDEMINRTQWVVPVLPNGELEILLEAAINLSKQNLDTHCEACQRFYRDGLTTSFTKLLTEEAASGWKFEIHRCIMKNCEYLIDLCVLKLNQNCLPLLELLAVVLNPNSTFHSFNGTRPSKTVLTGSQITDEDEDVFARPSNLISPRGWLVDLINRFGTKRGFHLLLEGFQNGSAMSVPVIAALIRPFGMCNDLLTIHTVEKYFVPIAEIVLSFLANLTEDELKNETENDALVDIVKALTCLAVKVPNTIVRRLETFRLKITSRSESELFSRGEVLHHLSDTQVGTGTISRQLLQTTATTKDRSDIDEYSHIMTQVDTGGEICQKHVEFDWKIENFSSLPKWLDYCYRSPLFYFYGRFWYLSLHPNGVRYLRSEGHVGLHLVLADSGPPLEVRYSLGIKAANGVTEVWCNRTAMFKRKGCGFGKSKSVLRWKLLLRSDERIPKDVLTLTATLSLGKEAASKNGTKNVSFQTAVEDNVSYDGLDGPPMKRGGEKVLEDIGKMWMSGDNSDVVLKVRDVEFKAHRTILAARTPVLSAMFQHDTAERASGQVTIEDCEPAVFEQLLHYIYTGAPRVLNADNAAALYVVADKYLVSEVKALCLRYMQDTLCVNTFCNFVTISLMHREQELLEMAIDFFSKNMLHVIKTVEWQIFLREHSTWANEILISSLELSGAKNDEAEQADVDQSHA